MNAVVIKPECDFDCLSCDFYIEAKPEKVIINLGKKKKRCKYEKHGECNNRKALKDACLNYLKSWGVT